MKTALLGVLVVVFLLVCASAGKAVSSFRNGNDIEIYLMNADGTNLINLSNNAAGDFLPVWAPRR